MTEDTQKRVLHLLRQLYNDGLSAAKRLFCTELNYEHANHPLSTRNWPDAVQEAVTDPPLILAEHDDFHVIYTRLSPAYRGRTFPLSVGAERGVIEQLLANHPYALFLFSDVDQRHWHLVNVRYDEEAARRRVFRRIAIGPHERLRTASERVAMLDLATLDEDLFGIPPLAVQQRHDEAFDVEAVTGRFFADYRRLFEATEAQIEGLADEDLRLFTQRLFNRLLFITFLERKGWLTFHREGKRSDSVEDRDDYLRALWEDHLEEAEAAEDGSDANFYRDRLRLLFFSGLNNISNIDIAGINRDGFIVERIGRVPYLNGGLFEKEALDRRQGVRVPDAIFGPIFDELIYHYNFTVTESTPLDIEVAVDPEMLGRIFEELVTGRHDSGSYYTPKPIVSFMCREALKGYLRDTCPREDAEAVANFVDGRDAAAIRHPEGMLSALQRVRVCDLACGSGAYLVGMLHELIELRQALFVSRGVDARAVYDKKLEVIQRNLYGVDVDPFAVNIARLRLWLSLTVEFEGEVPPPLPNLAFKIEVGDSLTGPAPGQLQPDLFHHQQVERYFRLKGEFMTAHGPEKADLRREIEALQAEIASWANENAGEGDGFDWAVTFAEVFVGPGWDTSTLTGAMTDLVNAAPGQMELAGQEGPSSGFDIVLTNPPYVRQELLDGELKEVLKRRYPQVYRGTADLYVYFYARALHLLREGGIMSFISSNKWLRANYGEKLRRYLDDKGDVLNITDFGELPVFDAATFPMIIVVQKEHKQDDFSFTQVKSLDSPYPDVTAIVQENGQVLPPQSIDGDKWLLAEPGVIRLIDKMEERSTPLSIYTEGRIYRGVVTGCNKAFVIDSKQKDRLVDLDPKSAEIIKLLAVGNDVRRWRIDFKGTWLIVTEVGIDIQKYPAILEHLSQWQARLEKRWDKGDHWWELRPCSYYDVFEKPKIMYPDIAKESRFTFDTSGFYTNNTVYFISSSDLYLLGVLNSNAMWKYASENLTVLGDADRGGRLRFFRQFAEDLPIPTPTEPQREAIEALVRKLLDAEGQGPQVEGWERELNALVYEVYGLTDDEIAIVEGSLAE